MERKKPEPANTPFSRWLKAKGLSYQDFAREAGGFVGYNTVVKWAHGTKPRPVFFFIKKVFPDCPLFQ